MKHVALEFYKSQKTPAFMEDEINGFLKNNSFKFANQIESPSTGKIVLSIFAEESDKASVKAKCFRDGSPKKVAVAVEDFLKKNKAKLKFYTQSFSSNTLSAVVFYE